MRRNRQISKFRYLAMPGAAAASLGSGLALSGVAGAITVTSPVVCAACRPSLPVAGPAILEAGSVNRPTRLPVSFMLAGYPAGSTQADASGQFTGLVTPAPLPAGRYQLQADCGPTAVTAVNVVFTSAARPITSTLLVILFFLVIGSAVFRRHFTAKQPGV